MGEELPTQTNTDKGLYHNNHQPPNLRNSYNSNKTDENINNNGNNNADNNAAIEIEDIITVKKQLNSCFKPCKGVTKSVCSYMDYILHTDCHTCSHDVLE